MTSRTAVPFRRSISDRGQLGQNGDRDLRRCAATDGEAHRPVQAAELVLRQVEVPRYPDI